MKTMDLNASPLPDEDELIFKDHIAKEKFRVTAPETMYQDREGRYTGSKRKNPYEEPMHKQGLQSSGSFDRYSLPPGWLDCPPYGSEIGYLIPSKVPLGESFDEYIAPEKRYTPKQVIEQQMHAGRELGLVIDLTNTSRYYPESDWRQEGIGYIKIKCRGRESVPEEESVKRFVYEVLQFRSRETKANKYILVHCTHGHNRTGYMIVHFLIRNESLSVTEAIEKFAEARPPGIYKQDYIDALYKFFDEKKPDQLVYPQTPEWKKSPDRDDDVAPLPNNNNLARPMQNNLVRPQELMTSDDVLGESVPYKQQEAMRTFCYQVLKMNNKGRGKPQFPGSHPVSLSRDNLELLRRRYYYATWKADGTRYMMLITGDGCYLIDRNFNFRKVHLRFPCKNTKEGTPGKSHHYTLLDGEMIIDTEPSTRKQERRYLIYDLVAINQVSIIERPFSERWMILENEVIKPRNYEREVFYKSSNPYYRYDLELFRVRRKDFYLLSAVEKLLKEFIPRLSHASDGLIFQGWDDDYVPRTHEGLLKWKYPEMNSVDFLFEMGRNNHGQLCLNERGKKKVMEGSRVIFQDTSDLYSYSGKIIECSWDPEERVWIFMRVRPDKSTPNEFGTYKKVMRSITDNITEEVLLKEIEDILTLPMYNDRINQDRRAFGKMVQHRRKE